MQQPAAGSIPSLAMSLVLGLGASVVHGQQSFTLSDEDTWEPAEVIDFSTPDGQLAMARRALAAGDSRRAEHLAGRWIDHHRRHPRLPDAYLIRGDALRQQSSYYDALFDYEYIARVFTGSEVFVTALERELEIAKLFAGGTKRKVLGMRIFSAADEAEELLIRIQERMPGSRLAEEAGIELADFYFRRRQMDLAVDMYSIFIENFPDSTQTTKARRRLIYAHLASFKGPEFDPTGLYEAKALLERLLVLEPATAQRVGARALVMRIDESDARKLLGTARWYLRTGDVIAAELVVRRLLREYPRSVAAAEAARLIEALLPRLPRSVRGEVRRYHSSIPAGDAPAGADTPGGV